MICDWIGHKYRPRFDLSEPTVTHCDGWGRLSDVEILLEASKRKTFVRDVCERCGDIIPRPPS
jgi:hypothetical protein